MKPRHGVNRRSFLAKVAGGAVAAGALGIIGGEARAWQTGTYTGVTDSDTGSHADSGGYGRGPGGNASGHPEGITDSDVSDPSGGGRGGATGYSDSDSGANADPSGRGRRGRAVQTGRTDSDPTDAYGQGQGTRSEGTRGLRPDTRANSNRPYSHYTGITDTDSGANRDPYNYGQGSRECRDSDHQTERFARDPARRCE